LARPRYPEDDNTNRLPSGSLNFDPALLENTALSIDPTLRHHFRKKVRLSPALNTERDFRSGGVEVSPVLRGMLRAWLMARGNYQRQELQKDDK
jgi:hypothetical protein